MSEDKVADVVIDGKKMTVVQDLRVLNNDTMPEFAKGHGGIESLLDGLTFQISAIAKDNREGGTAGFSAHIEDLNMDDYKDMTKQEIMLEVMSGCVTAYLAAMAKMLPPRMFSQIISPLADVLSQSLQQTGVITVQEGPSFDQLMIQVNEEVEELQKKNMKQNPHEEEFDKEGAIERAVEKLKSVGKGLIH